VIPAVPTPNPEFQTPNPARPTWAEVSLGALRHNYETIKAHVGAGVGVMAVVKADAYGHGAAECARAFEVAGARWFGVALVEEGVALRAAGVGGAILCLGGFWRGQAEAVIAHDLTPVIFRLDAAEELDARARAAGRVVDYHLKVDTGMGRLGVPLGELAEFARALRSFTHLKLDGLMTHCAAADAADCAYTNFQLENFEAARRVIHGLGFAPAYFHAANSAAAHAYPAARGNLVRPGAALYGFTRDVLAPAPAPFAVRPALSLHSRVVLLKTVSAGAALGYGCTFTAGRESRIATLPVGYADGYRRALSNNASVIVCARGGPHFAPVVGRVSMDLTLIDVTDVPGCEVGDEVLLLGGRGGLTISAEDLAARVGTISYEIACGVSARVPRVYTP
jgi:alanine racemase